MTRTQSIRAAVLGTLAHRRDDIGAPEDALIAESIMFVAAEPEVSSIEVKTQMEKLEGEGYISSDINPVLGTVRWYITEKGKPYAPKF